MRLGTIKVAENGFVLEDAFGNLYIAKTLVEAAELTGEINSIRQSTNYTPGFSAEDLRQVREAFRAGDKIRAIKQLRDCFKPTIGLKEAKEMVEQLCA